MKTETLNKPILTTDPHGEQSLRPTEEPSADKIGNRLFELSSNTQDADGGSIVMTGEELTSLAKQWLEYAKTQSNSLTPC